jgi:hypothetical protein
MVKSVSEIEISCPAHEVFEFISDPAKARVWHTEILEIDGVTGMPEGSTGTMVTMVVGREIKSRYIVVENDGSKLTRVRSTQGPLNFETAQMVTRLGPRLTRVRIETRIDAGSIFRLAEPALESVTRGRINADLLTLKAVLESDLRPLKD